MPDIADRPEAKVSAAEIKRRRKIVRQADAANRREGVYRAPETDAIVEASVCDDIDVTDMIPVFRMRPARARP